MRASTRIWLSSGKLPPSGADKTKHGLFAMAVRRANTWIKKYGKIVCSAPVGLQSMGVTGRPNRGREFGFGSLIRGRFAFSGLPHFEHFPSAGG